MLAMVGDGVNSDTQDWYTASLEVVGVRCCAGNFGRAGTVALLEAWPSTTTSTGEASRVVKTSIYTLGDFTTGYNRSQIPRIHTTKTIIQGGGVQYIL